MAWFPPDLVRTLVRTYELAGSCYQLFVQLLHGGLEGVVTGLVRFPPILREAILKRFPNLQAMTPLVEAGVRALLAEGWIVVMEFALLIRTLFFCGALLFSRVR